MANDLRGGGPLTVANDLRWQTTSWQTTSEVADPCAAARAWQTTSGVVDSAWQTTSANDLRGGGLIFFVVKMANDLIKMANDLRGGGPLMASDPRQATPEVVDHGKRPQRWRTTRQTTPWQTTSEVADLLCGKDGKQPQRWRTTHGKRPQRWWTTRQTTPGKRPQRWRTQNDPGGGGLP